MGSTFLDQQLGCLRQKDHLLSISLSTSITWTKTTLQTSADHHSNLTQCVRVHKNDKSYIYSGNHNGHINCWDFEMVKNDPFAGKGHTNQLSRMTVGESVWAAVELPCGQHGVVHQPHGAGL